MPALSTPGLVLRHADYGDYDRMVTLFTPESGRLDAVARGCRRAKSPLVNAVEPFTSGIYQIYSRRGRMSIDQCEIKESFYPLRADYDRLVHGAYWLKLLDAAVVPDVPAEALFLISLKALAHLCYSDFPPAMLTMAFEMHLMAQLGFSPRMDACVRCGRPIAGDARFDASLGGAVCLSCPSGAPRVSNGARRIMMKLPRTQFEKAPLVVERPEWPEAARLFRGYVDRRLRQEKFAPPLLDDRGGNS